MTLRSFPNINTHPRRLLPPEQLQHDGDSDDADGEAELGDDQTRSVG
jgi:hypothetical protein